MNKRLKNIIKFLLFFSVGIFIFWWVSKDQDINELKEALKNADYTWIFVSLFLGILSHISRALRWNLLIRPLGYKNKTINSLFSVMIMYLSNLAVPRSGEVIRCGVMSRTENIPFTKLLGTVFIERVIDFIVLFILLAIVLITQLPVVLSMLENNPEIEQNIQNLLSSTPILIGIILFILLFVILIYVFRARLKKTKIYNKIKDLVLNFIEGIKSILKMKRKFEFIAHSVFIWVMYFIMIYIVFWSFEFTSHLTLLTGLTVFVMSAFGMVAPSPGGMGTWHFMVIQSLIIYGVKESDAYAFAITSHTSMTLMMIVLGVLSVIFLPIVNRGNKKNTEKV